jgi:hypothetical protein
MNEDKSNRPRRAAVGRLVWTWGAMSIAALLFIAVVYTAFFGRNKVTLNETIYENHRLVGQPGAAQLATGEGYGLTTFGENGLIVDKDLDPDAYRIVFIGDSFVKAKQVSDRYKFTELVEQTWNSSHPDRPIQTLNLGLGGQDMSTYLSFGPNIDRHYAPDLVFLYANPNDFRVLARQPGKIAKIAEGLSSPLTHPQTPSALEDLTNRLGVRSFLGRLQHQWFGFRAMGTLAQKKAAAAAAARAPVSPQPAAEGKVIQIRGIDEQSLNVQLDALQHMWGDRLVVIYGMTVPQLGRDAPDTYQDQVMRAMEQKGIPAISLYEPLLAAFRERRPPTGFDNSILGTGHYNRTGHQLIAGEIIRFLESHHGLD